MKPSCKDNNDGVPVLSSWYQLALAGISRDFFQERKNPSQPTGKIEPLLRVTATHCPTPNLALMCDLCAMVECSNKVFI